MQSSLCKRLRAEEWHALFSSRVDETVCHTGAGEASLPGGRQVYRLEASRHATGLEPAGPAVLASAPAEPSDAGVAVSAADGVQLEPGLLAGIHLPLPQASHRPYLVLVVSATCSKNSLSLLE